MTETREKTPVERLLAKHCPHDTDGDGDCGQHLCPWCGTTADIRRRRFWFVRDLIKAMAGDIWGDTRISQHAHAVISERWGTFAKEYTEHTALLTMLGLNWGWEACVTEEWPEGPAGFLDEHLHYTRGASHADLIGDLRDLAAMLDPDHEERFPGGRANVRPRHPKAVTP